ncbi:autotransporter [Propionigenium maris DSM 9537]|uniref:Autotransporter n=1 Tax=Propionigenium maris DSM 9537 TaxID=1123000 RepID=A0A9W6LLD6_9FUSO|nr:AzlC family ABC transporter permease [Propionigenium maris]GLI55201.1 autotransporter [Propionigenium maris DSM 9537]
MSKELKRGVIMGVPIALGYIPIAMTFGVLSKTAGVTLGESFLFSSMVYAGASQFMAINMIMLGSGFLQIVIATLLLNLRHFLMSASLSQRMDIKGSKLLPFISFGVTDEAFSMASSCEGRIDTLLFMGIHLIIYTSWVAGTILGYLAGEILPSSLSSSMVVGLYAMFIAILTPQMKGSKRISFLVFLSGLINTIIKSRELLPRGWDIVATISIVALIGTLTEEKKQGVIGERELEDER